METFSESFMKILEKFGKILLENFTQILNEKFWKIFFRNSRKILSKSLKHYYRIIEREFQENSEKCSENFRKIIEKFCKISF